MAAMTLDSTSRGQVTLPANVVPNLCEPTPCEFPVGISTVAIIKCNNVAFGSRFQIDGADSAAATWVSPSTIKLTWSSTDGLDHEGTVISPEGLVSNKIRLASIPADNDIRPYPKVMSVTPSSGVQAGGTGIVIVGVGMAAVTAVTIGGVACTGLIVNGPGQISCITGAHAAGAVNVVLSHPRGNVTVTNGFTYV